MLRARSPRLAFVLTLLLLVSGAAALGAQEDGGATDRRIGDVNGDGRISTADALRLLAHLSDEAPLAEADHPYADTDQDGALDAGDAERIQAHLVGLTGQSGLVGQVPGGIVSADVSPAAGSTLPVARLILSPDSVALGTGQTVRLSASTRDSLGGVTTVRPITWASTDTSRATVNGTGLVSTRAPGRALVVATSEGRSDTTRIIVGAPVARVILTPDSLTMGVGSTRQLKTSVRDASNQVLSGRVVTYRTTDTTIAQVSGVGLVSARAQGVTQAIATSEGRSDTIRVLVGPRVARVILSPDSVGLGVGRTVRLSAVLRDSANALVTGRPITWRSSDTTKATVNSTGLVTARGPGRVLVSALSEGRADTSRIIVGLPVVRVMLSPDTVFLGVGRTQQVQLTALDSLDRPIRGRTVAWRSLDTARAVVSTVGLVTARSLGSTQVVATVEGRADTVPVVVGAAVARVVLSPDTAHVGVGSAYPMRASLFDASQYPVQRQVSWRSGDTTKAVVDADGVVLGRRGGAVQIVALSEGRGDTAIVVVGPQVMRVEVDPVRVGPTLSKSVPVRLYDRLDRSLTGRQVAYSVVDTTRAVVSASGVITGRARGTTQLIAVSEGKADTAQVSVETPVLAISGVTLSRDSINTATSAQSFTVSWTATSIAGIQSTRVDISPGLPASGECSRTYAGPSTDSVRVSCTYTAPRYERNHFYMTIRAQDWAGGSKQATAGPVRIFNDSPVIISGITLSRDSMNTATEPQSFTVSWSAKSIGTIVSTRATLSPSLPSEAECSWNYGESRPDSVRVSCTYTAPRYERNYFTVTIHAQNPSLNSAQATAGPVRIFNDSPVIISGVTLSRDSMNTIEGPQSFTVAWSARSIGTIASTYATLSPSLPSEAACSWNYGESRPDSVRVSCTYTAPRYERNYFQVTIWAQNATSNSAQASVGPVRIFNNAPVTISGVAVSRDSINSAYGPQSFTVSWSASGIGDIGSTYVTIAPGLVSTSPCAWSYTAPYPDSVRVSCTYTAAQYEHNDFNMTIWARDVAGNSASATAGPVHIRNNPGSTAADASTVLPRIAGGRRTRSPGDRAVDPRTLSPGSPGPGGS